VRKLFKEKYQEKIDNIVFKHFDISHQDEKYIKSYLIELVKKREDKSKA